MLNALIFAAGLGTRLGSITTNLPKALVPVGGKALLMHAIEKVIASGANKIVINTHHHSHLIKDFINSIQIDGIEILLSDESKELLDTGGGLLKAAHLFNNHHPILLYNADVITGANLKQMLIYHNKNRSMATLMVKHRPTTRYFLFNSQQQLCGWENLKTGQKRISLPAQRLSQKAFSGIHIVEQTILPLLGEERKFPIVDGYLEVAKHQKITGWDQWSEYWFDVGTPEKLEIAENYLKAQK